MPKKYRNGDIKEETLKGLFDYILPVRHSGGHSREVFEIGFGRFDFSYGSPLVWDEDQPKDKDDSVTKARAIYDQEKVVKVAKVYEGSELNGIMANIHEWNIWCQVAHDKELAKFLCPVVDISDDGKYLVMLKCEPATLEDIPDEVPDFFCDHKQLANWGVLTHEGETRTVLLDYALCGVNPIPKEWNLVDFKKDEVQDPTNEIVAPSY